MTLAERINAGIRVLGPIPMPSASKTYWVVEARDLAAGVGMQVRVGRSWCFLTPPEAERIAAKLEAKGF